MTEAEAKKLLRDRRVVDEINRHQWIESEKIGYDIGFDQAADDWLKNFSKAWIDYHLPKKNGPTKKLIKKASKGSKKPTVSKKQTNPKKRRAKTYL